MLPLKKIINICLIVISLITITGCKNYSIIPIESNTETQQILYQQGNPYIISILNNSSIVSGYNPIFNNLSLVSKNDTFLHLSIKNVSKDILLFDPLKITCSIITTSGKKFNIGIKDPKKYLEAIEGKKAWANFFSSLSKSAKDSSATSYKTAYTYDNNFNYQYTNYQETDYKKLQENKEEYESDLNEREKTTSTLNQLIIQKTSILPNQSIDGYIVTDFISYLSGIEETNDIPNYIELIIPYGSDTHTVLYKIITSSS